MKYLAAYALLVLGGNNEPTEDDIIKFFKDVGVAVDKEKLAVMLDKIGNSGKTFTELIQEGEEKLITLSASKAVAVEEAAEVPKDVEVVVNDEVDPDDGGIFNIFEDDE